MTNVQECDFDTMITQPELAYENPEAAIEFPTDMVVNDPQETPIENTNKYYVNVTPMAMRLVHMPDEDNVYIDMDMSIAVSNEDGTANKISNISQRIKFSKEVLISQVLDNEEIMNANTVTIAYEEIEMKPIAKIKETMTQPVIQVEQKKDITQRMRELAGVSHPKNWV